jgi:hypothetical protein
MVYPSIMNNKKMTKGLFFIVVLSAVVYGIGMNENVQGEVKATLIIERCEIHCKATLPAGSTVADLMKTCGVSFIDEGGFFTSIEGVSQDQTTQTYWMYYVNGEMAPVGARDYVVQDGDEITWNLESYS